MTNSMFDRRDAIKSLLAISASGALAACGSKADSDAPKTTSLKYAAEGQFFNSEEMALIAALSDTIIPTTDTPGAVTAGVPKTLQGLASEWGNDDFRKYWRDGLSGLQTHFRKAGGQPFANQSAKQRENLLGKYDADVFAGNIDDPFYRDFKQTVATAYYMSEPGATEELIYEPVPGEWKGCVPFSEIGRTWAT